MTPDLKTAALALAAEAKSLRRALDRRASESSRPSLATSAEARPQAKAFAAYVRQGDESQLRALGYQEKGMTTAVAADGGVLVDSQTSARIETVLRGASPMRVLANVVQVESGTYDALIDHSEMTASWIAESGAVTETTAPALARISIRLHDLTANPKASQRLLDDSAFDVESWLAERIAARFARAETAAAVTGDGADKPRGFLNHTAVANASWAWGSLGYVATGAAGAFAASHPGDALSDLVYALPAGYRSNASFVMNSKTAGLIRKMKDVDGRYLWSDGLAAGQPATLLGHAVAIVEEMPDVAANAYAVAFGDFRAGYTLAERPELRILRDPYSAKPHVLFYATKRVGGDVTDFAAIKLLKFAAS
ncbi:phage major capsid protein [Neomegalonema perideroedes]|uniref:phage major capsid protein n=1 Tax=Neomegalonema perideroedes TaxID=217219 RepID=UPI00035DC524|nr:phage major capsid protein [Neomegalonema perideroedes]